MIDARKAQPSMNLRAAPVLFAKSLLTLAALLGVACSGSEKPGSPSGVAGSVSVSGGAGMGGGAGETSSDSMIIPAGITVAPRPGINSVFNVIALTLRPVADGAELYAAIRNDGDIQACNASFSVELHDKDDQVIGNGISGLMVRHFYEFTDGSGTVEVCVEPGEVTMVAITSVFLDGSLADVHSVVYQSNYWAYLAAVEIPGVTLMGVKPVARSGGVAYTGTLLNGLDMALTGPTVAIFPVNAFGRPLGVAYGGASSVVLPPGGTWDFETAAVGDAGVGFNAYPMGGP